MTREEAIEILKDLWRYEHSTYLETDIRKALEMAIKALEQEPCRDMEEIKEIHCNCTDAEIAKSFIDRNMEFIMPEATMYVDPIPDESIHTIDFAHGYDYCKNAMKKEIHKLMNGTAGEFTRGWNLALKKVLEVIRGTENE